MEKEKGQVQITKEQEQKYQSILSGEFLKKPVSTKIVPMDLSGDAGMRLVTATARRMMHEYHDVLKALEDK